MDKQPPAWFIPLKERKCNAERECWRCFFYRITPENKPLCIIDYSIPNMFEELKEFYGVKDDK